MSTGHKMLSLTFAKPGDTRRPVTTTLMIQEEDGGLDMVIDLTPHEFASLMSGTVLRVEAR